MPLTTWPVTGQDTPDATPVKAQRTCNIEVIGISGRLGSGKNFVAEKILIPMLTPKKTLIIAFANHFKIDAIVKCDLDRAKVFGTKDEFTRVTLQRMGTEEGRDKYGEDIWVNLVYEWLLLYQSYGFERVIITDVRFENEVKFVHELGGKVFRIESPKRSQAQYEREAERNNSNWEDIANHRSESSLDNYFGFDSRIGNDFGDNPFVVVRDIARALNAQARPVYQFFIDMDDTICECHKYYLDIISRAGVLTGEFAAENRLIGDSINIDLADIATVADLYIKEYDKVMHVHQYRPFTRDNFAKQLVEVMHETLRPLRENTNVCTRSLVNTLMELGMSVFDVDYEPIAGSVEAIRRLAKFGNVVIFTVGDREEQMKKVAYLGLTDFPVEVVETKNVHIYRMLKHKYPAKKYFMVGDSMVRDIQPSVEAGFNHVYHITHTINAGNLVAAGDVSGKWIMANNLADAVKHFVDTEVSPVIESC